MKQPLKGTRKGFNGAGVLTVLPRNWTSSFHQPGEQHECTKETVAGGALRDQIEGSRNGLHSHFPVAMVEIQPNSNMSRDPFVWILTFSSSLTKGGSDKLLRTRVWVTRVTVYRVMCH